MTGVPPRGPGVSPRVSEARDRAVQALSQHFAQDGLTMEELDRRLALAYQAESAAELTALVADIPGGPGALALPTPLSAPRVASPAAVGLGRRAERMLALFSSTRRVGMWLVPERMEVVSAFAELRLDLRSAELSRPLTTIDVSAAFCDMQVIVPHGVRVVNRLSAVFAEVKDLTAQPPFPDAPILVLEGWAAFAAVLIRTS
ncbi:MAG: DUF1707 SHOCT-like domain-containing protein [Gemmatimonadaceae bacterium]